MVDSQSAILISVTLRVRVIAAPQRGRSIALSTSSQHSQSMTDLCVLLPHVPASLFPPRCSP